MQKYKSFKKNTICSIFFCEKNDSMRKALYLWKTKLDKLSMKSFLFSFFILFCMGIESLQAQSYDELWKLVEKQERNDQPQSVLQTAKKIFEKAQKENNYPQLVKAKMRMIEKECDLDPEKLDPQELEQFLDTIQQMEGSEAEKKARVSILHCLVAKAYLEMTDSYVHDFDGESQKNYNQKAKEHFQQALTDQDLLATLGNAPYLPLINENSDGKLYQHTLLIVLVDYVLDHARLDTTEIIALLQKAVESYRKAGNINAEILLTLRELDEKHSTSIKALRMTTPEYRKALQSLLDKAHQQQTEAEIEVAIALLPVYSEDQDENLNFIRKCIQTWHNHKRVNEFRSAEARIMATSVHFKVLGKLLPNHPVKYQINWENASKVTVTIREDIGRDARGAYKETGKLISKETYSLGFSPEIQNRRTLSLPVKGQETFSFQLKPGYYIVVAECEGKKHIASLHLTSLQAFSLSLPEKETYRMVVLDQTTGRPVPGATVLFYKDRWGNPTKPATERMVTNAQGELIYKGQCYQFKVVRQAEDLGKPQEDGTDFTSLYPSENADRKTRRSHIQVLTDRGVYRPGQTVNISAMAYTMLGDDAKVLVNSEVKLTVSNPDYEEIYQAEAKTNEWGSVDFTYSLPKTGKLGSYEIQVSGEKMSGQASIRMEEYKRPTFEVTFPKHDENEVLNTLGDTVMVKGTATLFSGVPVAGGKVEYAISWAEESRWFWHKNWQEHLSGEAQTQDDGSFAVLIPTQLEEILFCKQVCFKIQAYVTDLNGERQAAETTFKVKNPDYKEQPLVVENSPKDELKFSTEKLSPSQQTLLTFSAQEEDALVYYVLLGGDKIIKEGTQVLHGDSLVIPLKYKKEWGDGICATVFYIRRGHRYEEQKTILLAEPDKELQLSWSTFRDNLIPGQQEEWVLTVKNHQGQAISGAEIAAVMYDASLDALVHHAWTFRLPFDRCMGYYPVQTTSLNSMGYLALQKQNLFRVSPLQFDHLLDFVHQRWYRNGVEEMAVFELKSAAPMSAKRMNKAMVITADSAPAMAEESLGGTLDNLAEEENEVFMGTLSPTLRTNLQELAFFYPHLKTDDEGLAHIAFTLPESLTEWKFMALAHTADMNYGLLTATAKAKKDFMVQPNMPRFLRAGDKAQLVSKVMNLCEHTVAGSATLRIIENESGQVIYTQNQSFRVEAERNTTVTFSFDVTVPAGDYSCEIVATDGTLSDGERNLLPILSTRVNVVENVPFYLDGKSTKDVDLTALFNGQSPSAQEKAIAISYTDNPALEVFKSLQAIQAPKHENAPEFAASLYSNLVLLDMNKVLGSRMSFQVADAQETANLSLEKLQDLQLSGGGWSWFKGMDASYYITLAVAEHLNKLQGYYQRHGLTLPGQVKTMLDKAIYYLEKEELRIFRFNKAHQYPCVPSESSLRYLLLSDIANKEMVDTYLNELEKEFRNLTIYGRSKGALLLQKYNRPVAAKRFVNSVKEYTQYKEGFGRYFATDLAYYSWQDYRIPTQLAAMRVMDDSQYLLDMQLWLLRQKQTQVWENPLNAIDVADYLLTNSPEISLQEPKDPVLKLDGKRVVLDTSYVQKKAVKQLTVTKQTSGLSWGNVRATFTEEVDKLDSYSSGELTISRKIIREGQKVIIRHILHADRDMDFVEVKSQHAASLEPVRTVSGYQWMGGRGCYLEVHDSYINLFFDHFTRGTTTIDMEYYIARPGEYGTGYASIMCAYAPEFGAHTAGEDLSY